MPRFYIDVEEVISVRYSVEADTAEEAEEILCEEPDSHLIINLGSECESSNVIKVWPEKEDNE